MTALVIAMLLIVLVSAAVVVYVAYPHRGERMPVVPQIGDAMSKAVDQLPTVDQTTDWPAPAEPGVKSSAQSGLHRS
ncbi:MAG: hypothetical protein V9G04_04770 [Nocardioides sp.]|jgi:hypothetical protein